MRDDIDMGQPRGATPERSTASPERSPRGERIVALCLHETPCEPPHLDLFLAPLEAPFSDEERVLESWRLPRPPGELLQGAAMEIEPIGLHRGLYARLKQPMDLGGQLGRVTPVASGECFESDLGAAGRLLDITWSDGTVLLLGLEPGARVEDPPRLRRLARATLPS